MAALTPAEALAVVAGHLDDANNVRWSSAQLGAALQAAISLCIQDYASKGGDAFDVVLTTATDATGTCDLASAVPQTVRTVQVVDGSLYTVLPPARFQDRDGTDPVVRSICVVYVPEFAFSSGGSFLVAEHSWPAFDHWVCAEAALLAGIKDNDKRPGLEALSGRFRADVLSRINSPRSRPLRAPRGFARGLGLSWSFNQATNSIVLFQRESGC